MDRRKESPSTPAGAQLDQLDGLQVDIPTQALAALADALDQIAKGR